MDNRAVDNSPFANRPDYHNKNIMEYMKILTCNNFPILVSNNEDKLKEHMESLINSILNDDSLQIIERDGNTVTYHTGISYCTSAYKIDNIEVC